MLRRHVIGLGSLLLGALSFGGWTLSRNASSEVQRAIELCLQLHGGLGYMEGHWTSQWFRDARALTIAAGTPEVMRDLIAAHLRL